LSVASIEFYWIQFLVRWSGAGYEQEPSFGSLLGDVLRLVFDGSEDFAKGQLVMLWRRQGIAGSALVEFGDRYSILASANFV
jgi:hypothetical protein